MKLHSAQPRAKPRGPRGSLREIHSPPSRWPQNPSPHIILLRPQNPSPNSYLQPPTTDLTRSSSFSRIHPLTNMPLPPLRRGPAHPPNGPSPIETTIIDGVDVHRKRPIPQTSLTASILKRSPRNDKVSNFITLICRLLDLIQPITIAGIVVVFFII